MAIRCLIVDDEVAARRRLARMLAEFGVDVAAEAVNGLEALDLIHGFAPTSCCSTFRCRKSPAWMWRNG